jgi:hypothetical protein
VASWANPTLRLRYERGSRFVDLPRLTGNPVARTVARDVIDDRRRFGLERKCRPTSKPHGGSVGRSAATRRGR